MATLRRVDKSHGYVNRSASLMVGSGKHRLVAYRVPAEWRTLTEEQRGIGSVGDFKRSSNGYFLVKFGFFQCMMVGFWVCEDHSAGGDD
jgi:hypothetical protein